QPCYRAEFATASGWRLERELFKRLLRFGGPAGSQVFLDVLVFHLFTQMVGRLGEAAMGATTLTVRLHMVAFLPMLGLGPAVRFSFAVAVRGAGGTWFVWLLTFSLAWPIMVVPTFLVVMLEGSIYWAWVFATAHIFAMAMCFWLRFRTGKWKAMRVIEAAPLA